MGKSVASQDGRMALLARPGALRVVALIAFAVTIVQVLAVPLTALLDSGADWSELPLPVGAVFAVLIAGCALQSALLTASSRWPRATVAGSALVYLGLAVGLNVPLWLHGMHLVIAGALFLLATRSTVARTVGWTVAVVVSCCAVLFVWLVAIGTPPPATAGFVITEAVGILAPLAGAGALGLWWAGQNRRTTLAREEAELARQDSERRVREAQEEERARIAQELHDVAGQHLAGLVTLTDAAAGLAPGHPGEALRLLDDVRLEGRFAAASMSAALADLRAVGTGPHAATPDLRAVPALVDFWQRRGSRVELVSQGDPDAVPAVVSTTAYRVLQEGLTNAAKHAAGAPVRVAVEIGASSLVLSVENAAPAAEGVGLSGLGLGWGLDGMRSRVALLDGATTAARTPSGGWRLEVGIPMTADAALVGSDHD
jgi:signal transduction histidine kinase